jgi:hypothetical protein
MEEDEGDAADHAAKMESFTIRDARRLFNGQQ